MITFYPRDIAFWRNKFDFSDRSNYPKKTFKDRDELSKYIWKNWGIDDPEYPLTFIEHDNIYNPFDSTHTVHRWTTIGWMKEDE